MRVRDLISILSSHNKDMPVLVDGYEAGFCDLKAANIRLIPFRRDVSEWQKVSHSGPHEEDSRGEMGIVLGRG